LRRQQNPNTAGYLITLAARSAPKIACSQCGPFSDTARTIPIATSHIVDSDVTSAAHLEETKEEIKLNTGSFSRARGIMLKKG
jgi:hypothetical protein